MDRPTIIFGRSGQLARALARSLTARGEAYRVIGSETCDLVTETERCVASLDGARAVINASGFTAVDAAETQDHANMKLNAVAPGMMAAACARQGIPFVHVSTDYVFDGQADAPYRPGHAVAPINAYGRAKAKGERAVRAAGGTSLTLRTSWVFDGKGKNFFTTMLGLRDRAQLRVVGDQVGRPTHAGHLAEAILAALDHGWSGTQIHHVQGTGAPVSWAEFARAIFDCVGAGTEVDAIDTDAYVGAPGVTPAKRPAYSVLGVSDFETAFALPLQDWRDGLELALWEYSRSGKEI